jgi:hypothetical protein
MVACKFVYRINVESMSYTKSLEGSKTVFVRLFLNIDNDILQK